MVKLTLMIGLVILQVNVASAQGNPAKADIKTTPVLKVPANTNTPRIKTSPTSVPPPPPAAPGLTSRDYHLTSAKATIYTGNDNKEKPSQVQMQISLGPEGIGSYMIPERDYKEYAINSATELPFQFMFSPTYYYEKLQLSYAEREGMKFWIHYHPNFPLDAWKIEKVVFTVEFRDGNGNLHPTIGTKSITFVNIGALLNDAHGSIRFEADKFLMPQSSTVFKLQ